MPVPQEKQAKFLKMDSLESREQRKLEYFKVNPNRRFINKDQKIPMMTLNIYTNEPIYRDLHVKPLTEK